MELPKSSKIAAQRLICNRQTLHTDNNDTSVLINGVRIVDDHLIVSSIVLEIMKTE
jgi:hypothetical protein